MNTSPHFDTQVSPGLEDGRDPRSEPEVLESRISSPSDFHLAPKEIAETASSNNGVRSASGDAESRLAIVIASTFTAMPIQRPLSFWMDSLGIEVDIHITPYGQVIQELLNPTGTCATNRSGFNVLLIRIEDLIRDIPPNEALEHRAWRLRQLADVLVTAITTLQNRVGTPLLVFVCPNSLSFRTVSRETFENIRTDFISALHTIPNAQTVTHEDVTDLYPVERYEDTKADQLGHIPYSDSYFTALATLLARRVTRQLMPPYKVIALDCDNTLWKGICADDGAAGVELTSAHIHFQQILVRQYDAGMLLCLCSKNNATDVEAVFNTRAEMPLRERHLITKRVNWNSKSANLVEIANELKLSLDSFIFVDDSVIECAEVRAQCPAVLALEFPTDENEIMHFSKHVWAFDHINITTEARTRTAQYKENLLRATALAHAPDLSTFLASLELVVEKYTVQETDLNRVVELVQRTNQFNLTTIRRRATDIQTLCRSDGWHCWALRVTDRFGDYGLVGVLFFHTDRLVVDVDTFILSCRVLGRGVEHRVVNRLGEFARQNGLTNIVFRFRPTARNEPALLFLETACDPSMSEVPALVETQGSERIYTMSVSRAETLSVEYPSAADKKETVLSTTEAVPNGRGLAWHGTAYRFSRLPDILAQMNQRSSIRVSTDHGQVRPTDAIEATVARIWAEVLWLEELGALANFFQLGGDSFLAVRALARIASTLGVELSMLDLIDAPTVEQFAQRVKGAMNAGKTSVPLVSSDPCSVMASKNTIEKLPTADCSDDERLARSVLGNVPEIKDVYPVSALQEGILFHHLANEHGGDPYILSTLLATETKEQLDKLVEALQKVIDRHDVMRSALIWDGIPDPLNVVYRSAALPVEYITLDPDRRVVEQLQDLMKPNQRVFDLRRAPLMRLLVTADPSRSRWYALLQVHHVVADHDSLHTLFIELTAYLTGRERELAEPLPYRNYIGSMLRRSREYPAESFFRAKLASVDESTAPFGITEVHCDATNTAVIRRELDTALATRLRLVARLAGVSPATIFHAVWALVVSVTSGRDDVVYGTVLSGRTATADSGTNPMLGLCVSTLPLRIKLSGITTRRLLEQVQHELGELFNYLHASLVCAQRCSGLPHSAPLFCSLLNYRCADPNQGADYNVCAGLEVLAGGEWTNYPVALTIDDLGNSFLMSIQTLNSIDPHRLIEFVLEGTSSLLDALESSPERLAMSLQVLPMAERRQIIDSFNEPGNSESDAAESECHFFHELFEDQATQMPDTIAIESSGESLTYSELKRRSDRLSARLLDRGVAAEQLVGICAERGIDMIIALLSALKTGGAYVPLDPNYPVNRLNDILRLCSPRVVLSQKRLRDRFPGMHVDLIDIEEDCNCVSFEDDNPFSYRNSLLHSSNLAYVIFTSGSTGESKGVMIDQRGVSNLWSGLEEVYNMMPNCRRVALNASYTFDASVQQLVQLASGRTVVVVPDSARQDASLLLQFLDENRIDGIDCTPSQLKLWIAAGLLDSTNWRPSVILVGGEEIDTALWSDLVRSRRINFYNVYGPTECTVDVTVTHINKESTRPHIGRPMRNRRIYTLDRHKQPVPIGVPGEIYVGGIGIARGYFNRPGWTATAFLPDPFSKDLGSRMYKTGDSGRWQLNGTIEYLGRKDHQVKLRGFRIELGEIEERLLQLEQITQVVVRLREDVPGDVRLVAYVVPRDRDAFQIDEARSHLLRTLPAYMVPSAVVVLEDLPLTPSGKLSRDALPKPDATAYWTSLYEPPRGSIEETLATIWQEVLGVERIGRLDDFFMLGGNSIVGMKLINKVAELLGVRTPVTSIFRYPTIDGMAKLVEELLRGASLVPAEATNFRSVVGTV